MTPYATMNMTTVAGKRWSSASWVAQFHGHLVSDFYCGYNEYAGKHQRCWMHLLRDLHELKEAQAAGRGRGDVGAERAGAVR